MTNMVENLKECVKSKGQSGRVYIWLNRVIVCFLLFAAGMKTWQLATVPDWGADLLHARWFNILVVELELAFAVWLLCGFLPRLTWWATIGLFSTFASVSLYKALIGEASCGCFGQVQVNPWWTFGLDIVIVAIMFFQCRYSQQNVIRNNEVNNPMLHFQWFSHMTILAFVITMFILVQMVLLGKLSIIGGEHLFSKTNDLSLSVKEDLKSADDNSLIIRVCNKTNSLIRILGCKTLCSCGTMEGLPVAVLPHGASYIRFIREC